MTYKEIETRLKKCETILTSIKNGTYKELKEQDPQEVIKQVNVLKESLTKRLSEMEKGTISTDDKKTATDLADQGHNVELTKEENSTPFSVGETIAIAKATGKALVKALKQLGEELTHITAKKIEPNSFEIHVKYKNGVDDEFSFYITDDTLHIVDFTYDKELVDVGVKPSGEAVVNVDVLAEKFVEHFKSLSEEVNEPPVLSIADKIRAITAARQKSKALAGKLKEGEGDDHHYIKIPRLEYRDASRIVRDVVDPETGVKYEVNDPYPGEPLYTFYFIFDNTIIEPDDEEAFMHDLVGELQSNGIQVVESSIDDDVNESSDIIEKLKSVAQKYMQNEGDEEDYNPDHDDDYEDYAHPNIGGQPLDGKKNEHHDEAGMEVPADDHDDLDIGHQDDEPHMLKKDVYDIAVYAAKLYKQLKKYDAMDGEVDFPHWWQRKVTLAREYMSKAQHYLEFEEKEPMIDQLALEGKKYKSDAQRKAIYASKAEKGKLNEVTESDVQDAIMDLRSLIDEIDQKADEAREIVRRVFPNELSRLDAYGAFNAMNSSNRYDVTLGSFVDRLEDEGFEIEDGEVFTLEGASGTKRSVESIQREYSRNEALIKIALEKYKQAKGTDAEKAAVKVLINLNATKKKLKDELDAAVPGIGAGQELNPNINEYQGSGEDVISIIRDKAEDSGFSEKEEAMETMEFIADTYDIGFEFTDDEEVNEKLTEGKKTCCGRCGQVHEKKGNCTRKKLTGKARCDV